MTTSKDRKQSKDKQMTRKKKKVNWFLFLSDDILLEILKKLPDDFLRYKAKHVCRHWFNIVTNKILLDHASFILQISNNPTVRLVDITEQQKGLQVKEHNLEIPVYGWIISWCNEYLLITDLEKNEFVYNLITKEGSLLPHCTSCGGRDIHEIGNCGVALSFDGFVYKLVHVFMGPPVQCHILVLRKNIVSRVSSKWKKIEVPSYMNKKSDFWGDHRRDYWGDPVLVQGRYFHWDVHCDRYLVSMDMVEEKMFKMSLPISGSSFQYTVFEMGGFLTLIHQVSRKVTEIWVLKDFHKMKWEKLKLPIPDWCYFEQYLGSCSDIVSGMRSKRYITCMRLSSWDGAICSYDLKDWSVEELDIHIGGHDHRVVHSSIPSFI